jgi:hypothetical protein
LKPPVWALAELDPVQTRSPAINQPGRMSLRFATTCLRS